jgi:hypothetical protein
LWKAVWWQPEGPLLISMRRGDKMRREVILVDLGAACEDSREGVGRFG